MPDRSLSPDHNAYACQLSTSRYCAVGALTGSALATAPRFATTGSHARYFGAVVLYVVKRARVPVRFSIAGVCHGGREAIMMGSSVGASLRMCESHECHSGGTWDALKSCCEKSIHRCRPGVSITSGRWIQYEADQCGTTAAAQTTLTRHNPRT